MSSPIYATLIHSESFSAAYSTDLLQSIVQRVVNLLVMDCDVVMSKAKAGSPQLNGIILVLPVIPSREDYPEFSKLTDHLYEMLDQIYEDQNVNVVLIVDPKLDPSITPDTLAMYDSDTRLEFERYRMIVDLKREVKRSKEEANREFHESLGIKYGHVTHYQ